MACSIRLTARQLGHIEEGLSTMTIALREHISANERLAGDHPVALKQRAQMQKRIDSLNATREHLKTAWSEAHAAMDLDHP